MNLDQSPEGQIIFMTELQIRQLRTKDQSDFLKNEQTQNFFPGWENSRSSSKSVRAFITRSWPYIIVLNSKRDPLDPDAELFIYSPWNYTVIDSNNRVFGEFSPVYSQSGYIQRIYPGDKPKAKRQLHSIMHKSEYFAFYLCVSGNLRLD